MSTVPRGLPFAEALAAVVAQVEPLQSNDRVPLTGALGRALAESLVSRVALPPWDNAGMDGYAVRRDDVVGAAAATPRQLTVIGTSLAGSEATGLPSVERGTAVRIMTGAPVPPGADAVIRVEDTNGGTDRVIITSDRDAAGRGNIRPRGEDVAAGAPLFAPGTTLRAAHLGVLASCGIATVSVARRPRVTVLSSGDELVMLDRFAEVEAGRRIIASSSYALPPLLEAAGAEVTIAPIVPDEPGALVNAMRSAIDGGCDVLITTGGVSVGAHDFTRDAVTALGGEQRFWRARIRPGGPIGTGMVGGVPWLGLPGNPVSTHVTALLFAWPLLRRLGGHAGVHHLRVPVTVADSADTPAPLTYFLRVSLAPATDGTLAARLAGPQGSNLIRTMANTDALLEVPESVDRVQPGDIRQAILLPDTPLLLRGPA